MGAEKKRANGKNKKVPSLDLRPTQSETKRKFEFCAVASSSQYCGLNKQSQKFRLWKGRGGSLKKQGQKLCRPCLHWLLPI